MSMGSNNIKVLLIGIVTLILGFAAITTSYDIVESAHAAKAQHCYQSGAEVRCFSTQKECNDTRSNDPASVGRCFPGKLEG